MDYSKQFFLQEDIEKLQKYKTKIDDEIYLGTHHFFDLADTVIAQRIQEVSTLYEDILSKPFDYSIDEEIELDRDKTNFSKKLRQEIKMKICLRK